MEICQALTTAGQRKLIRIYIGEFYASRRPSVIYTLLGSCVAVCLRDPVRQIGGMNHILLPGKADLNHFDDAARYGVNAMELLINRIMNLGGERQRLVAKIFGGARTIPVIPRTNSMGPKNIAFVEEFLKKEAIEVLSRDLGGHLSRKIYFHTDTGEVFLKRGRVLPRKEQAIVEQRLYKRMDKQIRASGDVTLF